MEPQPAARFWRAGAPIETKQGVIIGATNPSVPGVNDTLRLSPAPISNADNIDAVGDAIDGASGCVFG